MILGVIEDRVTEPARDWDADRDHEISSHVGTNSDYQGEI